MRFLDLVTSAPIKLGLVFRFMHQISVLPRHHEALDQYPLPFLIANAKQLDGEADQVRHPESSEGP